MCYHVHVSGYNLIARQEKTRLYEDWLTGLVVLDKDIINGALDRVYANYYINDNGCYISRYNNTNPGGYKVISILSGPRYIHRFVYKVYVHSIYYPLEIGHTCNMPNCFNIYHLRQMPQYINRQKHIPYYPNSIQDTIELLEYMELVGLD